MLDINLRTPSFRPAIFVRRLMSQVLTPIFEHESFSRSALCEDRCQLPTVSDVTGGLGMDSIILCIGVPSLVNNAFHLARQSGRINLFAGLASKGWAEVEANLIHYKELEVTGSANSRRADFQMALQLIESGRINVELMVTDRYPLRAAHEALDKAASGEGIKIAVLP